MPIVDGKPIAEFNYKLNQSIKLPKFEVQEFSPSGDIHSFSEFWELFTTVVQDNTSVPASTKFPYLQLKLK